MNQRDSIDKLLKLVDKQIDDHGIWCPSANIQAAYAQQELRRLHALIEDLFMDDKH